MNNSQEKMKIGIMWKISKPLATKEIQMKIMKSYFRLAKLFFFNTQ